MCIECKLPRREQVRMAESFNRGFGLGSVGYEPAEGKNVALKEVNGVAERNCFRGTSGDEHF